MVPENKPEMLESNKQILRKLIDSADPAKLTQQQSVFAYCFLPKAYLLLEGISALSGKSQHSMFTLLRSLWEVVVDAMVLAAHWDEKPESIYSYMLFHEISQLNDRFGWLASDEQAILKHWQGISQASDQISSLYRDKINAINERCTKLDASLGGVSLCEFRREFSTAFGKIHFRQNQHWRNEFGEYEGFKRFVEAQASEIANLLEMGSQAVITLHERVYGLGNMAVHNTYTSLLPSLQDENGGVNLDNDRDTDSGINLAADLSGDFFRAAECMGFNVEIRQVPPSKPGI